MKKLTMKKYVLVLITLVVSIGVTEGEKKQCQEITIPMCKGIGYNYTYMPNEVRVYSLLDMFLISSESLQQISYKQVHTVSFPGHLTI